MTSDLQQNHTEHKHRKSFSYWFWYIIAMFKQHPYLITELTLLRGTKWNCMAGKPPRFYPTLSCLTQLSYNTIIDSEFPGQRCTTEIHLPPVDCGSLRGYTSDLTQLTYNVIDTANLMKSRTFKQAPCWRRQREKRELEGLPEGQSAWSKVLRQNN